MAIVDDYKAIGDSYHAMFGGWVPVKEEKAPILYPGTPEPVEPIDSAAVMTGVDAIVQANAELQKLRNSFRAKISQLNPLLFSVTKGEPAAPIEAVVETKNPWFMFGQRVFERYFRHANAWVNQEDYFDQDTGLVMSLAALDEALSKVEQPAGIIDPKDFRNEIVHYCLRWQAHHNGTMPAWRSYDKLAHVVKAFLNAEYGQYKHSVEVHSVLDRICAKRK